MSRHLLHKSKIDLFRDFLSKNGFNFTNGSRGDYIEMRVNAFGRWHLIHERHHMSEHLNVSPKIEWLVRKFIKENKDKK